MVEVGLVGYGLVGYGLVGYGVVGYGWYGLIWLVGSGKVVFIRVWFGLVQVFLVTQSLYKYLC